MWTQVYDPFGQWAISMAVAALPLGVLLGLLALARLSAWKAALAGFLTACAVASLVFGMPARMLAASALVGVAFAVLRIVWLILAAVFLYDVSVVTGQFAVMRASVASLSSDRRLQAVLVAFCFGASWREPPVLERPWRYRPHSWSGSGFSRFRRRSYA